MANRTLQYTALIGFTKSTAVVVLMLDEPTLRNILARLGDLSISVVGDLFLDKYLELDAALTEISVETGLEAYQVVRERCYPGAAGTVLNNLYVLGVGRLHAISVIGDDGAAFELTRELTARRVSFDGVLRSPLRMTPSYTKPMLSQPAGGPRELNRLDVKNRMPQPPELDRQVIERLDALFPEVDALIVADQVTERNCGVVTDAVRNHLAELARREPQRLIFADSRSHLGLFRGCTVKPNLSELCRAVGAAAANDRAAIAAAARQLDTLTGCGVYATLGPEGILHVAGDTETHVPGVPVVGPIDIVGAGDSTTAGIVCGLCSGATPAQAAHLGCLVASITIQQIGVTGTASPAQVLARLRGE